MTELDKLIEAAFEEKVAGKIPESVCVKLIEKYTDEQTGLKEKIVSLSAGLEEVAQAKTDVRKPRTHLKPRTRNFSGLIRSISKHKKISPNRTL